MTLEDQIPGYREALAKEAELRDSALLDAYLICGIPVRALTLRDVLVLLASKSTVLSGEEPTNADIAAFLWMLQPNFWRWKNAGELPIVGSLIAWCERRARRKLTRRLRALVRGEVIASLNDYLDAIFLDMPASTGGARNAPVSSFGVSITNYLAETYGWSRDSILQMPLPEVYQHIKQIELNRNPRAPRFNRLSDRIKGDWLRSLNKN